MKASARPVPSDQIVSWREHYRSEMQCQIVHDSIHARRGWTREYILALGRADVGYGSVATSGPWAGHATIFEFYVLPDHRVRLFDLFQALIDESGADAIEVQSNDMLAAIALHTFADNVTPESILFEDHLPTCHAPDGATFRAPTRSEAPEVRRSQLQYYGVVEFEGQVAGTGGVLFHYNPPFGDIHMQIAEPFRRRGLGTFLAQELKRVCYDAGYVPAARCSPANVASVRTLQKAGFIPCGHILSGSLVRARGRA